ncbi:hypothetical protein QMG83_14255 [Salinibacterium sp. G-O1]|uniref:hypothetical protein n=1 Tax=Salinibacterium sp. G-O1 TaxID=3046208 RepID=UPI0024B9D0B1|nr:hypothetical protein [Salinibacterium sp. G-O1]MDJ0336389.1 hypothetical protein [Salinibacterium sp. G-O1]
MSAAPYDDPSYERELQRRAYSKPMDGVDPTAAQAELAAIAESRRPAPEIEWRPLSVPSVVMRRQKLAVIVALAVTLAAASALALVPVPSLMVFSFPQLGTPTWPGGADREERADRIRWLASSNGWDVFAFTTTGGNICMAGFEGMLSSGGTCTSKGVFMIIGLRMGMSRINSDGTEYLSVKWGPTGGARTSDLPLAEWKD